ncbi:MAG: ferredoxin [Deltaproteobacteria bacterium]|nr:ferredoxin [Deltaproteobacteria bacterium]
MGEFISIEVDFSKCAGIAACGGCVKVCPVNIFAGEEGSPSIVPENEDECTLCDLCRQVCSPSAIIIHKRYEEHARNE